MLVLKHQVATVVFNLNALSAHQSLINFRFLLPEIRRLIDLLSWGSVTKGCSHVGVIISGTKYSLSDVMAIPIAKWIRPKIKIDSAQAMF